ncbi:MAG: antibiotic biosynthesis monooxygenase [Propionibacteriaceae bacterium]|nr:antibiotic biosynthesis monooxygenase [Propionibacteriaceae bacterium]
MTVKVVADNWLRDDSIDDFVAAASELVDETMAKDEGCIAYGLWRDSADPMHLTVLEEWVSQDALDKHIASEHFQRLFPAFGAAADPAKPGTVTIYEAV